MRCEAECQVVAGTWKKCIRSSGHVEDHVWLESLDRVNGWPLVAFWADVVADSPGTTRLMVPESEPG